MEDPSFGLDSPGGDSQTSACGLEEGCSSGGAADSPRTLRRIPTSQSGRFPSFSEPEPGPANGSGFLAAASGGVAAPDPGVRPRSAGAPGRGSPEAASLSPRKIRSQTGTALSSPAAFFAGFSPGRTGFSAEESFFSGSFPEGMSGFNRAPQNTQFSRCSRLNLPHTGHCGAAIICPRTDGQRRRGYADRW